MHLGSSRSKIKIFNILRTLNYTLIKHRKMCDFPTIFVRQHEHEDTMKINFTYGNPPEFPTENFGFMRSKNEQLAVALTRMRAKVQSSVLHKPHSKKKRLSDLLDVVVPPLEIILKKNGVEVDGSSKNIDAWTPETDVIINETTYKILVNPPSIESISLPKHIMVGFCVYPKVVLQFSSLEDSVFKWYRQISKDNLNNLQNDENIVKVKKQYWKVISEGYLYTTEESDLGCKLRVSCIPKSGLKSGMEQATVSEKTVTAGPLNCPFKDRHHYTKELTDAGSYRFVSYNILADLYADTDTARNDLFPYCPVEYLDIEYRKQLYLQEIIGYNGDILCLQEVDRKVFHNDLVPVFGSVNLKGVFNEKGNQIAEGLACFYRESKFKLVESHSIILSEAIKTEAVLKKIHSKILENEKLAARFMSRTTALQVTLLETLDVPKRRILVGNTHLYFHPNSDNIRLLQGACCLLYLEHVVEEYQKQDPSYTISVVLSGDFNSCPEFAVYKLATEGFLPSNCIDWHSNPEEKVDGMDISHSLQLCSACGIPEYTNYTEGFFGCLDYIFYDRSLLKVTSVVQFPTHEQVVKLKALPNQLFPSDHIALVSTLSWK